MTKTSVCSPPWCSIIRFTLERGPTSVTIAEEDLWKDHHDKYERMHKGKSPMNAVTVGKPSARAYVLIHYQRIHAGRAHLCMQWVWEGLQCLPIWNFSISSPTLMRSLTGVASAARPSASILSLLSIRWFTMEGSPICAPSMGECSGHACPSSRTRESTLERSPTNALNVGSPSNKAVTSLNIREPTVQSNLTCVVDVGKPSAWEEVLLIIGKHTDSTVEASPSIWWLWETEQSAQAAFLQQQKLPCGEWLILS